MDNQTNTTTATATQDTAENPQVIPPSDNIQNPEDIITTTAAEVQQQIVNGTAPGDPVSETPQVQHVDSVRQPGESVTDQPRTDEVKEGEIVVANESEKQPGNNTQKPTGFQLHPENINRNGRPSRDWTWAGLLIQVAEEEKITKGGSKMKWKEIVAKRLFHEAMNGNIHAIKEVMNRMDGMPDQNQNISADKNLSVKLTREA